MYNTLLVDDDRSMLYILRRYKGWAEHGFSIEGEACDGREALARLSQKRFDFVLTDIKMPGMDGMELAREIERLYADCTVVFLSTVGDFAHARRGFLLGAFDYLLKPVDDRALGEMLDRVSGHLDERIRHEEKHALEKRRSEDILGLYVPRQAVAELSDAIFSEGCDRAVLIAENTYEQIQNVFGKDDVKTQSLLCVVLEELAAQIRRLSPVIGRLEDLSFDRVFQDAGGGGGRQLFIAKVAFLSGVVTKYELGRRESVIRTVCNFVLEHAQEPLTLEKVAEEVNLRGDYIGKLFRKKTGRKLSEYITAVKMEHAKYLLRSGDYKNYELCEKLGYTDTDYFCRLFKSSTGMTPATYKNSLHR